MSKRVDIQRCWLPQGETPSYLRDSTSTLDELEKAPVLILLGVPGSGKTDTVRDYKERRGKRVMLKSFSEVTRKAQLASWMQKCFASQKTLILDAYDEKSKDFRHTWLQDLIISRNQTASLHKLRIVS